MFPVVPNMHDIIVKSKPSCDVSVTPQMSHQGHSDIQPAPRRIIPDSRYHSRAFTSRAFTSRARSERDELVQSLHVPRNARQVYGNKALSSSSPPEDSDDTSSFMSSVVVVPRPTGGGYEVYRSQLATPLEDPQYEDSDLLATMNTSAVSFTASLPGGSEHTSRALRPRTGTEAETVARRGAQFSKNIFNPAMQKRAQNKLQEASKRSEMYGSIREDKQWEYDSLNNRTHARSPTFSPPVRRNSGASSVMSPAPSPSKDIIDLPTGKSPLYPSSTSPAVSALRTCDEPSSGNLRPRTLNFPAGRTSPTLINTGRRSFHESLAYDPRKDPFVGGNSTGHMFDSLGLDAPQSSLKPNSTVKEHEQNFSRKTVMLGIIKKLRSPKKQDPGKQSQDRLQKEAGKSHNASVNKSRSSNSFSDNIGTKSVGHSQCSQDDFDCSCKIYHRHPFSEDYVNSDVEARKERREQIIQNSLREEPEQNRDSVEDPRNIFWTPALSFHPYHHGDRKVAFSSLWPKYKELREHLQNSGIQQTVLGADAVLDLCMLACTCGPTHLLQCLVDLQLILNPDRSDLKQKNPNRSGSKKENSSQHYQALPENLHDCFTTGTRLGNYESASLQYGQSHMLHVLRKPL